MSQTCHIGCNIIRSDQNNPSYLPSSVFKWTGKNAPSIPKFPSINPSPCSFTFSNVTWTQHDWWFQETQIHVERLLLLQLHLLRCCNTMLGRGNKAVPYHHIQYAVHVHVFSVNKSVLICHTLAHVYRHFFHAAMGESCVCYPSLWCELKMFKQC